MERAYSAGAGDLLTADLAAIRGTLDMAVTNLLMVVQAALPDLKAQKDGAILVINGGLGYFDAKLDAAAVQWNTMGLSVANAAATKAGRRARQEATERRRLRRRGDGLGRRQDGDLRQRHRHDRGEHGRRQALGTSTGARTNVVVDIS